MTFQQSVTIFRYQLYQGLESIARLFEDAPSIEQIVTATVETISGYVPSHFTPSPQVQDCKFRKTHPLVNRLAMTRRVLAKYPDRIPFIIIPGKFVPELSEYKFLIERQKSVAHLLYIIRSRIQIHSEQYIYIVVGEEKVFPCTYTLMSDLYNDYKSIDGFLYVTVELENAFG